MKIIKLCALALPLALFHADYQALEVSAVKNTVKKVVVFDIGGVLATYSQQAFGMQIFKSVVKKCGVFKTLKYVASQGSKLKERLHTLLHSVLEEVGLEHVEYPVMYDEQGNPYPRGLCLLQAGILSSEELVNRALHILQCWWCQDKLLCKQFRRLRSQAEMEFIKNTIQKIGNGKLLSSIFKPCKEGLEILKDMVGAPNVEVMILSNYPIDQFDALLNQPFMKQALSNVPSTHFFCSGKKLPANPRYGLNERLLPTKPHPAAFGEIILFCHESWGINPQDIIFIDNQPENVAAARALGIDGLLVNSNNTRSSLYSCTFKELKKLISLRLQLAQVFHSPVQSNNNLVDIIYSVIAGKAYTH